jgi:hypothetical protein
MHQLGSRDDGRFLDPEVFAVQVSRMLASRSGPS